MNNSTFILLWIVFILGVLLIVCTYSNFRLIEHVNSLTLFGQYTVSNYTSDNGQFKIFLLSKDKLNFTVLENDNDITDKLLVVRISGY